MPIQKMYTSIHKKQSEDISVNKNQSSLKSLLNFIKLEIKKLFLRKAIYIPYHLEKYIFNRIRKNSLEYVGRF